MNAWSNIRVSPGDPEIKKINDLEKGLGELPDEAIRIRELITRFEVCHFKYRQHLKKIRKSITDLKPTVDTSLIGINHIQHGESVVNKDETGKSMTGQQYVWALKAWLNDNPGNELPDNYDKKRGQQVQGWLGEKAPDKTRLVRLLLARLTWDWAAYEKLQQGGKSKELEFQACRMDICHYAFPGNLDLLLKGIGRMKAVEEAQFEGCGSYNSGIRAWLEKEFLDLNGMLISYKDYKDPDGGDLIRLWLVACLAKTIKENIKIETPILDHNI